jgi:hypothetical protein
VHAAAAVEVWPHVLHRVHRENHQVRGRFGEMEAVSLFLSPSCSISFGTVFFMFQLENVSLKCCKR